MKFKQKKYLIIGMTILVLLIVGYLFFRKSKNSKQKIVETESTEEILPTVDSSVKVYLRGLNNNREVLLEITNIPNGTESIDYELSYQTTSKELKGIIGSVVMEEKSKIEKRLTLGTCSSGTCVYHQVAGKISLILKFSGNYGDKIFEKEYEL